MSQKKVHNNNNKESRLRKKALVRMLMRFPAILEELCATLLACSLFCLFPSSGRGAIHLPTINFDHLFSGLCSDEKGSQQEKIGCLIHYLERITSGAPIGYVSYERKVLPQKRCSSFMSCPEVNFWEESLVPLCKFKAASIEYASSFLFAGDYRDKKPLDSFGRKQARIIAIDALYYPGMKQYGVKCLLRENKQGKQKQLKVNKWEKLRYHRYSRETNKAFSGFYSQYQNEFELSLHRCSDHAEITKTKEIENFNDGPSCVSSASCSPKTVGVATGNWCCGAFGGDPELKCVIQWLASSQASIPFVLYYTFGLESLQRLKQVTEWILQHKWTVGELWSIPVSLVVSYTVLYCYVRRVLFHFPLGLR